jgi:hypothetical protein
MRAHRCLVVADVLLRRRASGDEQGSGSQGLKAAVYRDPAGTTFVHQKDRRVGCVSLCNIARRNPATGRDF